MLKLYRLLKCDIGKIVAVVIALIVNSLSTLALPTLMSEIVDNGINGSNFDYTWKASLIMLAVAAVGLISRILSTKKTVEIICNFSANIKHKVFEKVNGFSFEQFAKKSTGGLITRSTEDIWMLEEITMMFLNSLVTIPMFVIGGTVLAFMKDPYLAIIMFAFVPVLVIAIIIIAKKIHPLWVVADEYIDKQNNIIRERLTGIRVIRAFNREDTERERANDATKTMATNIIKSNVRMQTLEPLAILLLNFATILVVLVGAVRISKPESLLSAGDIICLIQYLAIVMSGIMSLSFSIALLPKVRVNCQRINEILDVPLEVDVTDTSNETIKGSISMKGVSFKYENAEKCSLENANIEIAEGEKIAVIGGTGSGKSTLVNLIMRFYSPTEGEISYGGISYREMSAKRVRDNISCALQKGTIFAGTIAENIRISKPDASDLEVKKACEVAQFADFIEMQKEGYNYPVTQGGTNLSGGQKQRLLIARAILKPASVYLFDDSFSALDFLTEAHLKQSLADFIYGKTQVIITQRVTSAMNADRIYVLDEGKIVGFGKHKELMKNCSIYREIFISQSGGGNYEE